MDPAIKQEEENQDITTHQVARADPEYHTTEQQMANA